MAGLVPAIPISVAKLCLANRDARHKAGHDNREVSAMTQAAVATPPAEKMLSRKEGSVGYVTFNNPERHNAVSLDMWRAAGEMLDDFRSDNNIKVVVVHGAGGKAFVSGADISRFEKERSDEEAVARYNKV